MCQSSGCMPTTKHRYKEHIFLKTSLSLVANIIIYATLLPFSFSVRIKQLGVFLHTVRMLVWNFLKQGKNFQCFKQEVILGKITAILRLSDMMQVVIHNGGTCWARIQGCLKMLTKCYFRFRVSATESGFH